ncbi:MAG: hypothetical protein JWM53_1951 [bacterium]|nr:hypothetical protein [bacterium]
MDEDLHERLTSAAERLRTAVRGVRLPEWIALEARRCVIDVDCALSSGITRGRALMLLSQTEALLTVAEVARSNRAANDADER